MSLNTIARTLLLAGFLAFAVTHGAQAQSEGSAIIRTFTATDIGQMMEELGGSADNVSAPISGSDTHELAEIVVPLTYGSGTTANLFGMNCDSAEPIENRQCTHFLLTKRFEFRNAEIAALAAQAFNMLWYSTEADGSQMEIRRMDWISNGVTRDHLQSTLEEFGLGLVRVSNELHPR
jgi:hypothetical protein